MKMFVKIACLVVLCMLITFAPHAEAVTSCQIQVGVVNCLPYLQNRGPIGGCCGVIKDLLKLCKTPHERRKSCRCVKKAANTIKALILAKLLVSLEFVVSRFLLRSAPLLTAPR
ncbi:non-specific lipid-transfer protein 1-like [Solanum stenotomum]|uniref:non-specific lipid-transfer protein 1-like n=1 Tax=Solanum stenotomum TaxID=172797 RepID=UPI0020D00F74|nr:non-specific lipid-transfer protein 1-like [Solanum stenotomum]